MKRDVLLLVATLAAGVLLAGPPGAQTAKEVERADAAPPLAEVLIRLRAGGYTIHFRHAVTDFSPDDGTAADADCGKQRNLSAAGREQACGIGEAIRALGIPIETVLAGPLCRTMETAFLMFGRAQSAPDVRGGGLGRPDYPGLRRLLSTRVPAGTNRVLVGHGHQFRFVSGAAAELAEGEGAVVEGTGDGKFAIIARIRGEDWSKLRAVDSGGSPGKR